MTLLQPGSDDQFEPARSSAGVAQVLIGFSSPRTQLYLGSTGNVEVMALRVICRAPFGRAVKRSSAALRSLERESPFRRERAWQLAAWRLAHFTS